MTEPIRGPYAVARSATGLAGLSLASPLAGLAVEMALAWRFGASATVDAFRTSALLILFGQQIFVFQVLPNVMVPLFAAYRAQRAEREAWEAGISLANLLVIPTAGLSALLFLRPDLVVHLLGPGLDGDAERTAVFFARWFALTFVPLVWSGMIAGVLYAYEIFWLPAASQLLGNVVLVSAIVLSGPDWGPRSLVVGVLAAAFVTWALFIARLVALMRRVAVRPTVWISARHPGVRRALRLALPLAGVVLIGLCNTAIINRVLSRLGVGTLATFWYAWKMGQMASLLPAALATVLFPRFAASWHSAREGEFRDTCTNALRMAVFLALPATCILFALRAHIVTLLFQRGSFAAEAGGTVARLFGLLLVAVPASVACVYAQQMLYAVQATWIPAAAQLGVALGLTALARIAAARFAADGVMVTCVALTWASCVGLLTVFHRAYQPLPTKSLAVFAATVAPLAVISAWLGGVGAGALHRLVGPGTWSLALTIAVGMCLASLVYYSLTLWWRFPEALESRRYLDWQRDVMIRRLQSALHG